MNNKLGNWLLFTILAFIWGSSFILMKAGLKGLSASQVASIRIISSGIVMSPVAFRAFKVIPRSKIFIVFMSGVLGSLLPAYLFCIAEERIDSSLAGTLNSLTPIFAIIAGALFFQNPTSVSKIIGISIAFAGSVLLFFMQPDFTENNNLSDVLLIMLATVFYGINVNMVRRHLQNIGAVKTVAAAMTMISLPALAVLYITGYFRNNILEDTILTATLFSVVLGIFGTALASVLFYMLIKRAGVVFSSMVTYGIPIVANIWGFIYGEKIGLLQILCLLVILSGIYYANRKPATLIRE